MSFEREKRVLLAWLALLAPLPLPFNEAISWGTYLLYAAGLVALLWRARRDPERWMPIWLANLLALAYLPFLAFDLAVVSGGRLVGPMLRLGLFAVLVKLWSLRRERDKWHATLGIFFLFIAASATSVHLSVVFYLLAFLAGSLFLLARFALLHLLAGFGRRSSEGTRVPLAAFLTACVVTAALVAVPLFALLPRVSTPYLGRGGRMMFGDQSIVSGFSDAVTLDSIGSVRTSREVALRLTYEGVDPPAEIRLKGGAFDRLDGRRWLPARHWRDVHGVAPQEIDLAPAVPRRGTVEVWRQPMYAKGLPLPVEAVAVEVPLRRVDLDRGGALSAGSPPRRALQYSLAVGDRPRSLAPPPGDDPADATLDTRGVTPRMAALAAEVAGQGSVAERAERLERYFVDEFDYTLDFVGRESDTPLEDFLFKYKSGHCEYFASAMVLLLRSQGIHARLVTGFLGGELNRLGYVVVRQGNAHAWVEAWVPGEGWRTFDPTPPAGRPAMAEQSLLGFAGQVYDSLVFQWDRYVLTYGVEDQIGVLQALWQRARHVWDDWLGGSEESAPEAAAVAETGALEVAGEAAEAGQASWRGRLTTVVLLLVAVLVAVALWRRYHGGLTATRAYHQLRGQLARAGLPLTAATGPLALRHRAAGRWPAAAPATARLVDLYLRESFGSLPLDDGERRELREVLQQARRAVRT